MKIQRTLHLQSIEFDPKVAGAVATLSDEDMLTMAEPGVTSLRISLAPSDALKLATPPLRPVRVTLEFEDE